MEFLVSVYLFISGCDVKIQAGNLNSFITFYSLGV